MAKVYFDHSSKARVALHNNLKATFGKIPANQFQLYQTVIEYIAYREQYLNKNVTTQKLHELLKPFGLDFNTTESLCKEWRDKDLLALDESGYIVYPACLASVPSVSPSMSSEGPPEDLKTLRLKDTKDLKISKTLRLKDSPKTSFREIGDDDELDWID